MAEPWVTFDEHFDSSLPARFSFGTQGSGASSSVTNSEAQMDRGSSGDGVLLTLDSEPPTDEWWTIESSVELANLNSVRAGCYLFDASGPLNADQTSGTLDPLIIVGIHQVSNVARIVYRDSGGTLHYWTGSTWTTTAGGAGVPDAAGDIRTVRIQNDGANERFRVGLYYYHPGADTAGGGLRLSTLTDWVSWSSTVTPSNGRRWTWGMYASSQTANEAQHVERIRVQTGFPHMVVGDAKTGTSDYRVKSYIGTVGDEYDVAGGILYVPRENTNTDEIPVGSGGSWDDTVVRRVSMAAASWPIQVGDTVYAMYMGASGGALEQGFASAVIGSDLLPGSWTKDGSNPYSWGGISGHLYREVNQGIWVACYSKLDTGTIKLYVRTSTSPTPIGATWSGETEILTPSVSGSDSQHVSDPCLKFNVDGGYWELLYSGAEASIGPNSQTMWGIHYASTAGAGNPANVAQTFTKGGSNPLRAWNSAPFTQLNGASGAASIQDTVDSTTGFARDQDVIIDDDGTADNWVITRIRKVVSGTVFDWYHSIHNMADNAYVHHAERGSPYPRDVIRAASGNLVLIGTHFRTGLGDVATATMQNNSERNGWWFGGGDLAGPWTPGAEEPLNPCTEAYATTVHSENGIENPTFIHAPSDFAAGPPLRVLSSGLRT